MCHAIKFGLTGEKLYGGDAVLKRVTRAKVLGLYYSGILNLVKTSRLIRPSQLLCERLEAMFQPLKAVFQNRCNWSMDHALRLIRRCQLALAMHKATNTRPILSGGVTESKVKKLYNKLYGGNDDELYSVTFSAEEVRTELFAVILLRWCVDYIHAENSKESITLWTNLGEFDANGVCPVTIKCNAAAVEGALMFDGRWATVQEMVAMLSLKTRDLVKRAVALDDITIEFPGWKNLKAVLKFLEEIEPRNTLLHGFLKDEAGYNMEFGYNMGAPMVDAADALALWDATGDIANAGGEENELEFFPAQEYGYNPEVD